MPTISTTKGHCLFHPSGCLTNPDHLNMGMPVMDGYALVPTLKQLNPQLPVIISSGFGDMDVFGKIGSDNIAGVIGKPYKFVQLREVLKGVVEGARPR